MFLAKTKDKKKIGLAKYSFEKDRISISKLGSATVFTGIIRTTDHQSLLFATAAQLVCLSRSVYACMSAV